MFEFAFAANDTASAVIRLLGGQDGKTESLPVHPGEKPTKAAHKKWAKKWRADLSARRFGPLLRGEMPFEIKKLADRAEIVHADPSSPTPAIVAENAKIQHQNELNKIERESRLEELKNMVASLLQTAMQDKAPLRLAELQKKHQMKDAAGAAIEHSYDGVAMFLDEEKKANDGDVSEWDENRYIRAYETLRDKKLPDNCKPQAVSERFNLFNTHVNPYLGEMELKGERLSKFLLSQLPSSLASDVRSLRREIERQSELDQPDKVAQLAVELVERAHDGSTKSSIDEAINMVACIFDDRAAAPVQVAAPAAESAINRLENMLNKIASANLAGGKELTSGAAKKKARKLAAAMAAAQEGAAKPKLRLGNRLPEGTRCSSGTCEFAHDHFKPGEPCYRDPRWAGPIENERTWNNEKTMARI